VQPLLKQPLHWRTPSSSARGPVSRRISPHRLFNGFLDMSHALQYSGDGNQMFSVTAVPVLCCWSNHPRACVSTADAPAHARGQKSPAASSPTGAASGTPPPQAAAQLRTAPDDGSDVVRPGDLYKVRWSYARPILTMPDGSRFVVEYHRATAYCYRQTAPSINGARPVSAHP